MKKKDDTIRVFFYNLWNKNPETYKYNWFFRFIEHSSGKSVILNNLRQDISFYSVFGKRNFSKGRGKKVFFTGENVHSIDNTKYNNYQDHGLKEVDLAIGFDNIDDLRYQRFPLWILYFFPADSTKEDIQKKIDEFNARRFVKSRFCSLIARHDYNGIRKEIYEQLSAIDRVDSAGTFLHNDDSLKTKYGDNKIKYLEQYRFSICPENSLSEGYITEKLFESMWSGCIPIYWGPDSLEDGILYPDWILRWQKDGDNERILSRISELNSQPQVYESFISQKKFSENAVDIIWDYFEQFRDKISNILDGI